MLGLSEREVALFLLNAFLCGVCLGIVYESIRAFKMLCGVKYREQREENESGFFSVIIFILTLFTDVAFWLFAGIVSIILTYAAGGVFRGSAYIAMAVGFLLYYFTLGKVFLGLNIKITSSIRKVIIKIIRFMLKKTRKLRSAIISRYHLTIGGFFDKIKGNKSSGNENEREDGEESVDASENLGGKGGIVYVERGKGYRREGRISFGKRE